MIYRYIQLEYVEVMKRTSFKMVLRLVLVFYFHVLIHVSASGGVTRPIFVSIKVQESPRTDVPSLELRLLRFPLLGPSLHGRSGAAGAAWSTAFHIQQRFRQRRLGGLELAGENVREIP